MSDQLHSMSGQILQWLDRLSDTLTHQSPLGQASTHTTPAGPSGIGQYTHHTSRALWDRPVHTPHQQNPLGQASTHTTPAGPSEADQYTHHTSRALWGRPVHTPQQQGPGQYTHHPAGPTGLPPTSLISPGTLRPCGSKNTSSSPTSTLEVVRYSRDGCEGSLSQSSSSPYSSVVYEYPTA